MVFTCAGPAHGAYFAAYEAVKRQTGARLGRDNPVGHSKFCIFLNRNFLYCFDKPFYLILLTLKNMHQNSAISVIAGAGASLVHDAVMTPVDGW